MMNLPLEIFENIAGYLPLDACSRLSQAISSQELLNPLFRNTSFCHYLLDRDYYTKTDSDPLELLKDLKRFRDRVRLEAFIQTGYQSIGICPHMLFEFGALNVCALNFEDDDLLRIEDASTLLFEIEGNRLVPYTENLQQHNAWTIEHANSNMRVAITRNMMVDRFNDIDVDIEGLDQSHVIADKEILLIGDGLCRWIQAPHPAKEPFGQYECIYPTASIGRLMKRTISEVYEAINTRIDESIGMFNQKYTLRYVTALGNLFMLNKEAFIQRMRKLLRQWDFELLEIHTVMPDQREAELFSSNPRSLFPFGIYGSATPTNISVQVIELTVTHNEVWMANSHECLSPVCHNRTLNAYELCPMHLSMQHMTHPAHLEFWKECAMFRTRKSLLRFLEKKSLEGPQKYPESLVIRKRKVPMAFDVVFVKV
jgi:hypothetical protein